MKRLGCCQCGQIVSSFSGSTATCADCNVAPRRFTITVPSFGSGGPCPSAYIGTFTLHYRSSCQWSSDEVPICTGHVPDGVGGTLAACFNYGTAKRFILSIASVGSNLSYSLVMDAFMHQWPATFPDVHRNWCRVTYEGSFSSGSCITSRSLSKNTVQNTVVTSGNACGTANSTFEWAWGTGSSFATFPSSVALASA